MPLFIHECPYCHLIHEGTSEINAWCDDHRDQYDKWYWRGGDRARWDYSWLCPGCDQCKERVAI